MAPGDGGIQTMVITASHWVPRHLSLSRCRCTAICRYDDRDITTMISIRDEPMNRRTILWVIAALLPLVLVVSAEQVRATEPALTRDQVVAKAWLAMFGERKMNSIRSIQREKGAIYLFESNRRKKFTTRWIREITKKYTRKAGITKRIHPPSVPTSDLNVPDEQRHCGCKDPAHQRPRGPGQLEHLPRPQLGGHREGILGGHEGFSGAVSDEIFLFFQNREVLQDKNTAMFSLDFPVKQISSSSLFIKGIYSARKRSYVFTGPYHKLGGPGIEIQSPRHHPRNGTSRLSAARRLACSSRRS